MKSVIPLVFILLLQTILAGCAGKPEAPKAVPIQSPLKALLALHEEWQGVPYRFGGSSKRGIDCSALVALALKDMLGRQLPRTVAEQRRLGKEVPRNELQSGDLLFFKTGSSSRHVGIYLDKDRFLHASTSKGVTISSLLNPYWAAKYWVAKRLR
ncbi:NlpC/P60 family protein [Shewanella sp. AS16]|uniref:NlpC/P60 family protein n=1 Tax=Shewanella sp. AS16 TaxID=2907625 RepID=UPI001F231002|nr:NlpC/P60 family protein [Shewanella sp. AS16]MCE9688147.1 NlpC/P60 family protein [Shewanella sp. AS16]